MIAAVSFDLLPEATKHIEAWQTGVWMLIGVAVFLLADALVERRFGSEGAGGAMGIIVGSVVDGVPESLILGIQVGVISIVPPFAPSHPPWTMLESLAPVAQRAEPECRRSSAAALVSGLPRVAQSGETRSPCEWR